MRRQLLGTVALAVLLLGCSGDGTTREEDGTITGAGEVRVDAVQEGDCVDMPASSEVSEFTGIPCDEPHDAQVYALFEITGDDFPGDPEVTAQGETGCASRFEAFVGKSYEESIYYINTVRPTELSWERGDREVICLIAPEDGSPKLTQDLAGIGE